MSSSGVLCPMCGAPNPRGSTLCQHCGEQFSTISATGLGTESSTGKAQSSGLSGTAIVIIIVVVFILLTLGCLVLM